MSRKRATVEQHPQVELADLGFEVDAGMEDLIRACWHRGICTAFSCIDEAGAAVIHFPWVMSLVEAGPGARWHEVTGLPVTWHNPDTSMFVESTARFPRTAIPDIVTRLRSSGKAT